MFHLDIFIYFLLAHLLADFAFQPGSLIAWKHKSWMGIFVHTLIMFATTLVLFWPMVANMNLWGIVIIALNSMLHFAVDSNKIHREKKNHHFVDLFFQDQLLHLMVLAVMTLAIGYLYTFSNCPTDVTCGLDTYFQGFMPYAIYLIALVLCTYVYEIVKYEAVRQKHIEKGHRDWPMGWAMKFNYKNMFLRLVILSLIFGLALFLTGFHIAQTYI